MSMRVHLIREFALRVVKQVLVLHPKNCIHGIPHLMAERLGPEDRRVVSWLLWHVDFR